MKKIVCILLVLAMSLSLIACASQPAAESNAPAEGSAGSAAPGSTANAPAAAGDSAVKVADKWYDDDGNIHVYATCTQTITSLDWMDCNNGNAFQCIFFMIGTPLVGTDHVGNYGGDNLGIAERYEFTEDGKEWTFYLREGVTFNNGEPCNADDVVATLERAMQYKGQKANLDGAWQYLEKVERIDDYTVKAYFSETYGTPEQNFAEMFILSDTDYAELGDDYFYKGHLYGTGPWVYEDYMDGQYITLSRRSDYWGENDSNVDRFTLYFITEENAIVTGLTSGTLDFTPRLSGDLLSLMESDPDLEVSAAGTYRSYAMIGLQCGEQSPFHDVNLRRAFAYSIDRQAIADSIMGGGEALQQWLPKGSVGYDESLVPIYDPEQAKALVAQSDYNGESITLIVNSVVNNGENVGIAVCDYAKAVGINMSIQIAEQAFVTEVRKTGEYDAYLVTNTCYGDEGAYTRSRLTHPGANHNYYNDRLIELLDELPHTVGRERRDPILKEINTISYNDCVLVSLFTMDYNQVSRVGLTGWEVPSTGYFYCYDIKVQ